MPPRTPVVATEDHPGPLRMPNQRGREALVVAFPESKTLPVPIPADPLGRDWLSAKGIIDGRVSTRHLAIHHTGSAVFAEDLGSRNGTWIDGVAIRPNQRIPIDDGTLLRVGRTLLVYRTEFLGDDAPSPPLGGLVGPFGLRAVAEALAMLRARPTLNVLIEGETGTGKELAAAAVADALGRAHLYAPVNVAGVASGVFESQLFGYVPGAYSGSGKGSPGVLVAHRGGAVFLDEIGELPLDLQPKLLRVVENREVLPVGAVRPTTVDVAIIAATNRALAELVERGTFRRDLHARLAATRIDLPPLRERVEDVFAIMQALAERRREHYDAAQVEVEAMERLLLHAWPANVRDLDTALRKMAGFAPPPALPLWAVERALGPAPTDSGPVLTPERVAQVLASHDGNESAAARRLGITRGKLRRFLAALRK